MQDTLSSAPARPTPGRAISAYVVAGVTCASLFGSGSALGFAAGLTAARATIPDKAPPAQRVEVVVTVPTAAPAPTIAAAALPAQGAEVLSAYTTQETLAGALDHQRLGEATAPVQIVVFADPQCPFCKKMSEETEKAIIKQYVSTGKVAITYRHFAFLGPESTLIAQAMECAGQQGKFWAFHDYAFANQYPENSGMATSAEMANWAKISKLDAAKFKTCLDSPATKSIIEADQQVGRKLRVTGTPTLFVNGKPMPGAVPFDMIKVNIDTAIDSAVSK